MVTFDNNDTHKSSWCGPAQRLQHLNTQLYGVLWKLTRSIFKIPNYYKLY